MFILGVVLCVVSWLLGQWIESRKFNRRDMFGGEGFSSYTGLLFSKFVEGSVNLIGTLIGFAGIILLVLSALHYFSNKAH